MVIVVIAKAEGRATMYGYATVTVDLIDENDNAPRFSQERYVSSVWEGNSKGTFVAQVGSLASLFCRSLHLVTVFVFLCSLTPNVLYGWQLTIFRFTLQKWKTKR